VALAQAEAQAGNLIGAENYYQHAEHFFRLMSSGANDIEDLLPRSPAVEALANNQRVIARSMRVPYLFDPCHHRGQCRSVAVGRAFILSALINFSPLHSGQIFQSLCPSWSRRRAISRPR
jgi:hypothetical protein